MGFQCTIVNSYYVKADKGHWQGGKTLAKMPLSLKETICVVPLLKIE